MIRRTSASMALVAFAACASSFPGSAALRPAVGPPDRFEPLSVARVAPADTLPGNGCLTPLVDQRDGAQLRLVRSLSGVGDYQAPANRYGASASMLVRIDCNSGRPLGLVPK